MLNKKWLSVFAVFAAVLTIAWAITVRNPITVDDSAAVRARGDFSDVHYYDDKAIALSGEIHNSAAINAEATVAHILVNEKRTANGLTALSWSNDLGQTALVRAQECQQKFSHTRPDGTDWWTVNSDIMYGENLAKGYSSAAEVVEAWMDSETHRAAILNNDWRI